MLALAVVLGIGLGFTGTAATVNEADLPEFDAVGQVLGEFLAFTAFFVGQHNLARQRLSVGLGTAGVLRAVASAGLYLWVVAMVGFGIGALLRHTAAALGVMFAVIFLAWPVARSLEGWTYLPDRLLLANAADVLAQVLAHPVKPRVPSLGMAYLDLALYIVVALGLGVWRMTRDPA